MMAKRVADEELGSTDIVKSKMPRQKLWTDQDDDETRQEQLQKHFETVSGPTPSWATGKKKKKDSDDEGEGDDDIHSTGFSGTLCSGELSITKVLNVNAAFTDPDIIRAVHFHPKQPVALIASMKKHINFYKIDGNENPHMQSCMIEGSPISQALFCAEGREFYVTSGKANYFWAFDTTTGKVTKTVPSRVTKNDSVRKLVVSPDNKIIVSLGKNGNIYVIDKETKALCETFTTNGEVRDVAFNGTGSLMFALTEGGQIYQWNMGSRTCIGKITDDGTHNATTLAASSHYIAAGSNSGIVNIYEASSFTGEPTRVTPLKSFMNLTTSIKGLAFNHTGQLLSMFSNEKPNAIRMADMKSMTVYSNFPFVDAKWNRPNTMSFSPNSGYFSFGNNTGNAYLFRINHFDAY